MEHPARLIIGLTVAVSWAGLKLLRKLGVTGEIERSLGDTKALRHHRSDDPVYT